jgi:hypothetical protein
MFATATSVRDFIRSPLLVSQSRSHFLANKTKQPCMMQHDTSGAIHERFVLSTFEQASLRLISQPHHYGYRLDSVGISQVAAVATDAATIPQDDSTFCESRVVVSVGGWNNLCVYEFPCLLNSAHLLVLKSFQGCTARQ